MEVLKEFQLKYGVQTCYLDGVIVTVFREGIWNFQCVNKAAKFRIGSWHTCYDGKIVVSENSQLLNNDTHYNCAIIDAVTRYVHKLQGQ